MNRRNPVGGGRRTPSIALYLLLGQMAQVGFNKIPPVTLVSIAAQVGIFLRLIDWTWINSSIDSVCISVLHVWYRDDLKRLLLATFFHLDEWHLYFNMVSLLWKGMKLEKQLGSVYFALLVAIFSVLVNVILVALSMAADFATSDHSYITQCAAGFSGVLFALKIVLNDSSSGVEYVMGIPIPSRFVCWAELILIHILVPRSSFLGHLAGIIAGLIYVKGPLKMIIDILCSCFTGHLQQRRFTGGGISGTRPQRDQHTTNYRDNNRNSQTFNNYMGGMNEQQQMDDAIRQSTIHRASETSARTSYQDITTTKPSQPNASLDEIRKRRLDKLNSN